VGGGVANGNEGFAHQRTGVEVGQKGIPVSVP
jgi:hypothetical protein